MFDIRKDAPTTNQLLLVPSHNGRTRGDLVKLMAGKFRINKRTTMPCAGPLWDLQPQEVIETNTVAVLLKQAS